MVSSSYLQISPAPERPLALILRCKPPSGQLWDTIPVPPLNPTVAIRQRHTFTPLHSSYLGFQCSSAVKNLPAKAGDPRDLGLVPGLGRYPGEGNGNPLQYFCQEIPWTEEPSGLQSIEWQRVRHDWVRMRAFKLLEHHKRCDCLFCSFYLDHMRSRKITKDET